jgi:hypothetical protein
MAQTFTDPILPGEILNFNTDGTANDVTIINLPRGARILSVRFTAAAGKVATLDTLTDSGALGANAFVTVDQDTWVEFRVRGRNFLAVASATSSVACQLMIEGD